MEFYRFLMDYPPNLPRYFFLSSIMGLTRMTDPTVYINEKKNVYRSFLGMSVFLLVKWLVDSSALKFRKGKREQNFIFILFLIKYDLI